MSRLSRRIPEVAGPAGRSASCSSCRRWRRRNSCPTCRSVVERTPKPLEPPFYAHVRRDYYGYFPTCWSRFPEGWACPCPNPELPNAAASFRDRPLDKPRDPGLDEPGMEGEEGAISADPGTADPNMPEIPAPGRSPFDLQTKPDTPAQPAAPAPGAQPLPERGSVAVRPEPRTGRPPGRPRLRPRDGHRRRPRSARCRDSPRSHPTLSQVESRLEPGAMTLAPEATLASNRASSRPNLGPLPDPNPGQVPQMSDLEPTVGLPAPAPVQAPQRRSLLGGLFGQGNRRRR